MVKEPSQNVENELHLLEAIANTPETTQADLAARVGVAVGTVNWYLKRWSQKGYVKIRRIGRWQWSYLLTSEGMSRKARLASEYLDASLGLYRRTRLESQRLLQEVRAAGVEQIVLDGQGEIAEICRLTCLEMGVEIVKTELGVNQINDQPIGTQPLLPILIIDGIQIKLVWPAKS